MQIWETGTEYGLMWSMMRRQTKRDIGTKDWGRKLFWSSRIRSHNRHKENWSYLQINTSWAKPGILFNFRENQIYSRRILTQAPLQPFQEIYRFWKRFSINFEFKNQGSNETKHGKTDQTIEQAINQESSKFIDNEMFKSLPGTRVTRSSCQAGKSTLPMRIFWTKHFI